MEREIYRQIIESIEEFVQYEIRLCKEQRNV